MGDNTRPHINSSKPKPCKQLWQFDKKHLVIIDKTIIEKLGITENSIIFLEQEVTSDSAILMRIKEF
jgi:hypothetical protein